MIIRYEAYYNNGFYSVLEQETKDNIRYNKGKIDGIFEKLHHEAQKLVDEKLTIIKKEIKILQEEQSDDNIEISNSHTR